MGPRAEVKPTDASSKSVAELKEIAKTNGLIVKGTGKAYLVEVCQQHFDQVAKLANEQIAWENEQRLKAIEEEQAGFVCEMQDALVATCSRLIEEHHKSLEVIREKIVKSVNIAYEMRQEFEQAASCTAALKHLTELSNVLGNREVLLSELIEQVEWLRERELDRVLRNNNNNRSTCALSNVAENCEQNERQAYVRMIANVLTAIKRDSESKQILYSNHIRSY